MSGIIYAEKMGDGIELNAGYTDKELTRSIPGSRFHSPPPVWTVNLTWASCRQLRGTFGSRLQIGPELRAWAERELAERVQVSLDLRDEAAGGPIPLKPPAGRKLRPFQESDVRWMLAANSGLLMNPVGAGKTPSMITWMRNRLIERGLVICPAAMRLVWVDEMAKWYPELEAIPIIGSAGERRKLIQEVADYGGLAIIGLEATRLHSRLAPYGQVKLTPSEKEPKELNGVSWQTVIVDEAHRLADPTSKQTRASWAIGQSADTRWGMTATPQTKGLDTLWSVLHFIDPEEWPARSKFVERYCIKLTNFFGGVTIGAIRPEMEQEFQSIFDPRSRRLPKAVVLPQLPPVVRVVKEIEMTPEQATAYRQMAELSIAGVAEAGIIVAASSAATHARMGQFASSYARVEERLVVDKETREPKPKQFVELEEPSNKINAFMSDLEDWQAQEEAVVAFATSRKLIMLLSEKLTKKKLRHSLIVGGQKDIERHEQIREFQAGETDIILVVIAAGGTGITLTRARIGAFLQRSWSNVEDQQAEGRFHRIGSEVHESVVRVDYLSIGTNDIAQFYDVLPGKEDMLQKVLRDEETIKRVLFGGRV